MNEDKLIDQMVQRLAAEVKNLLSQARQGQVATAAVERVLRDRLWHFGAQSLGVLLEGLDQQLVKDRPVHDRRTRTVVSLFGPLDLTRSRCQDGSCPLDDALGLLGHRSWTAGVQEAASLLSCETGFETVRDLMGRLLGVSISAPSVQVIAEEAGFRAQALRQAQRHEDRRENLVGPRETLVIPMDGCQAPERDGWHEVKVGTLYVNESRCRTGTDRSKLLRKEYLATLEKAEGFGKLLRQRAQAVGMEQAASVVCMGDGAPWIWNLVEMHFPSAVEIVDFYHAVEHLWAVGEALWGNRDTGVATRSWVRRYRKRLKQGRVDLVIGAIERGQRSQQKSLSSESAKTVRLNLEYFRTNGGRMAYGRYRKLGLPIGTGAVEGSCKFVVQSRFKRPGSRWSHEGLGRMLALKLVRLNGRWESLWPHLQKVA